MFQRRSITTYEQGTAEGHQWVTNTAKESRNRRWSADGAVVLIFSFSFKLSYQSYKRKATSWYTQRNLALAHFLYSHLNIEVDLRWKLHLEI